MYIFDKKTIEYDIFHFGLPVIIDKYTTPHIGCFLCSRISITRNTKPAYMDKAAIFYQHRNRSVPAAYYQIRPTLLM